MHFSQWILLVCYGRWWIKGTYIHSFLFSYLPFHFGIYILFLLFHWFHLQLKHILNSPVDLSVQFSSVHSLSSVWLFVTPWTKHTRPPCPSPTPGVYPNPCPISRWCHPTISSSVFPFSSCPQSFPASGSFQMSQFFASGGQNTGVSASTSVLPMNTQDWSPLGWTGWVSLQSKGLSRVFYNTTAQKHPFSGTQLSV